MTNTEFALAYQALDELAEIAEARKAELGYDFEYEKERRGARPGCWYVNKDHTGPSCIVGVWLHEKKGVPLDALYSCEGESALVVVSRMAVEWFKSDDMQTDVVNRVQEGQDGGMGWVRAVQRAREWLDNEVLNKEKI